MSFISTKGVYVVAALYTLYHAANARSMQVKEIAAMTKISATYLEQLLSKLKRAGFLHSVRGANGGFSLTQKAHESTLFDMILVVEPKLFDMHENVGSSVILDNFWQHTLQKFREMFAMRLSEIDESFTPYFYDI